MSRRHPNGKLTSTYGQPDPQIAIARALGRKVTWLRKQLERDDVQNNPDLKHAYESALEELSSSPQNVDKLVGKGIA